MEDNKALGKVQKERTERYVAAYNIGLQRALDQLYNSKKELVIGFEDDWKSLLDSNKELLANPFEDEYKSLLGYSSSEISSPSSSENSKKVNERKMPSQTSPKLSRRQAYKKYKSGNNMTFYQNRNCREASYSDARNSSSRIQNSKSYQKSDKPNELPESTSRQNVKHEAKNSSSRIQNFKFCPKADKSNEELPESTSRQNVKYEAKNSASIIQNSKLCPKADKSNEELPESTSRQNVKYETKNSASIIQNSKLCPKSTEGKNSCLSSVKSEEYIPFDANHSNEDVSFKDLDLLDLLYYNVDLMQHRQLENYAFALKEKTLKVISEFKDSVRDELKFLCAITDGTQTDKNQKLISRRMYFIIANAIEEVKLSNAYCERQVFEQTQNLNLTSRIKHVDPGFVKGAETTEESNFVDRHHKNSSLDSLVTKLREAVDVTNILNLESNMSNIRATELISNNAPMTCEEDTYNSFGFEKLLDCNVKEMRGSSLFQHAFALKEKILERNFEICEDVREKLEFLCEITDGSQTELNQKLIVNRMHYLLVNYLPKNQDSFKSRKDTRPRKLNYNKETF